jgi:hypothetical protein
MSITKDIPIVIICYNNYRYVENTLTQILRINKEYYNNIIILNNASTCEDTIGYLRRVATVASSGSSGSSGSSASGASSASISIINNIGNFGPWIAADNNNHIYDILPDKFVLTDPDLKLNENIPSNFIDILATLSDKYKTTKIGLALDITDCDQFYPTAEYMANLSIYDWEKRFWKNKIDDPDYELYEADIDTTFCLINKRNLYESGSVSASSTAGIQIRVAGDFTAKHIPWYIDNEIYNMYDNYAACINTTHISTIARIVKPFVENNYLRIYKNGELFLIKADSDPLSLSFWRDTYNGWEIEMFEVFDKYLTKDTVFIDIGKRITPTSLYAARKSKRVFGIEYGGDSGDSGDGEANATDTDIMKDNCSNYTHFASPLTLLETLETILKDADAASAASSASFIRLDIDGKEEDILSDLYDIHIKYGTTLFINFNYSKWNDKNIDRFPFLSLRATEIIRTYPMCYILF